MEKKLMIDLLEIVHSFSKHEVFIALVCIVVTDYLTGFALALKNHRLSSSINFYGIIKKVVIICLPLFLYPIFYIYDYDKVFDVFIYSLIVPDLLSLVENLDAFGVKLPEFILKFFDNQPPKNKR